MWESGQTIVRRDLHLGRPWFAAPVIVVRDDPDLLVSYTPEGAPFGFVGEDHPWFGRERWSGHGALELQRPGEEHAVRVFWSGPERSHAAWYFNLQAPFRRTPIGFDTSDQVLDLWLEPGGEWHWKDAEEFARATRNGRFTPREAAAIQAQGDRLAARLVRGERWWDESWAAWAPDPAWKVAELPEGWDVV